MKYWVYILRCSDNAYYVGSHRGENIENRVGQHNAGQDPYAFTWPRRPVELVWCQEFQRPQDAIAVERQIKGWTRTKKEAAIAGKWNILPRLAARREHNQGEAAARRVAKARGNRER